MQVAAGRRQTHEYIQIGDAPQNDAVFYANTPRSKQRLTHSDFADHTGTQGSLFAIEEIKIFANEGSRLFLQPNKPNL